MDPVIPNPHQSDLTVGIFSTLHLLVDHTLFRDAGQIDAQLSSEMSARTGQVWLCVNDAGTLGAEAFHTALVRASQSVSNCYLTVCALDPVRRGLSSDDQRLLVESIMSVNVVMKRKVLFASAGTPTPSTYSSLIEAYAGASGDSLARYVVLPSASCADACRAIADVVMRL